MRKSIHGIACGIVSLCCVLMATPAHADTRADTRVDARLDPSEISIGDTAQLTVTVNGQSVTQPSLPQVPGLSFRGEGQSSQIQIINGAVSARVTFSYRVSPLRAGTFTIPPIQAGPARSAPLTLRVLQGASSGSMQGNLPPPAANLSGDDVTAGRGELAFLRVKLPRKDVYVGELVPVRIRAYFRAGMQASINGLPTLKTDAFTLSQLTDKPQQTEEMVNGQPYAVLTWNGALSGVKAGDYPLLLQLPATLAIRERPTRPRDPFGDPLNDPFGGNMFDDDFFQNFFGRVRQKQVTLQSDNSQVKVLPLPEAGRPSDFSGAVGDFAVQASASPLKLTAGDPITLKLTVSGEGNFDRVASSMLPESRDFKTYSPSSRFEPKDSAGYQGQKTFEQAVVPLHAGEQRIPALPFSYFDPQARRYVKRATAPIRIEVAPSLAAPAVASVGQAPSAAGGAAQGQQDQQDLVPNQVEPGRFVSTLLPVSRRGWFLGFQAVPLLLMAGGVLAGRRYRRLRTDPHLLRAVSAGKQIGAQLREMDRAAAARDTAAFVLAARAALQQRLGQLWGMIPEAITLSEAGARLGTEAEGLRPIFDLADQVTYSGQALDAADFPKWKRTVIEQLSKLARLAELEGSR